MKKSEAGTLSSLPYAESLTPTSNVPMSDSSALVSIPDNSSSQRKEVGSSRSSFSGELDRIREESCQPFVPFHKDQRQLKVELPDFQPILPPIAEPRRNLVPIPNSTRVRGDHFHV